MDRIARVSPLRDTVNIFCYNNATARFLTVSSRLLFTWTWGKVKDARVRSLKLAEAPLPEQIVDQHVFVASQLLDLARDPSLVGCREAPAALYYGHQIVDQPQ